ncbi:MAG: glutamate formimidoyltransferase [Candidatus Rokubacteria bacterium]|nr:glutamate formimidoyltransferase [Candidatus Rokubacteria bacterium]
MSALLECVPNVSEGRDGAVIRALREAVEGAGAELVDVHSDVDHHRSVFTFLGPLDVVERATLALAREAVRRVDLTKHRGAHPRVGAIDVIPFVPLRGATMRDAIAAAHRTGLEFAAETDVPVFFYAEAAARRTRRELPVVRRGGFEALPERMCDPGWRPDAGPAVPHPTAGATVIGARGPLIAFNAVLGTDDLGVAKAVAAVIRELSGGLPAVQAMGVWLASRRLAQVSMNLLDYRLASPQLVAAQIEDEAARWGVRVLEYELVGCAPADAVAAWPPSLAPLARLKASQLLDPALFVPAAA